MLTYGAFNVIDSEPASIFNPNKGIVVAFIYLTDVVNNTVKIVEGVLVFAFL